jgi:nucleoside-diphosphate-sugar epimerase
MTAKTVLLAGAGDLCQRAAALLLAQGHLVWGLRRHPPLSDGTGIRWIRGDLTQAQTLHDMPRKFSDVIYAPTPDARTEEQYRSIFVTGLQHLISALDMRELKRFLLISSTAVYGPHLAAWTDENTHTSPLDFNGRVLLEAERRLAHETPNAVVFRLSGLYGPGRTRLLTRLAAGSVEVPRHGDHWANRFHIDDAARAAAHLLNLHHPESCYVGSDNRPHKIGELYDALADMLGAPRPQAAVERAGDGNKPVCNARLRASGFDPSWPDAIEGYRALINMQRNQEA